MNGRIRQLIGSVRPGRLLALAVLHILGTLGVAAAFWMWMLPPHTRSALREAMDAGVVGITSGEVVLHLALSACFWAFLSICYHLARSLRSDPTPRLVKARGTVITETIIVLPIFLILNLGLIQLAILNTASLLTQLAAFNAGRVVAIWHPEAMEGRKGVTTDMVNEKARVAAAMALTPVAPSDFPIQPGSCSSTTLDNKLEGLEGLGHTTTGSTIPHGEMRLPAFWDASDFETRGRRKLIFAHCATTVEYAIGSDQLVRTVVRYQQQIAMPLVANVFGQIETVGGRMAYFTPLERDHITTHQIPPCVRTPGGRSSGTC